MSESDISSFTYNHGAPISREHSFKILGRIRADGIAPPYRCDLSPAENGLVFTVAGEQGGVRAAHLSLSLLRPIMEKRAELWANMPAHVAAGGRNLPELDAHNRSSADAIMQCLDGEGIHIARGSNTAEWFTSSVYDAMESVMARINQSAAGTRIPT